MKPFLPKTGILAAGIAAAVPQIGSAAGKAAKPGDERPNILIILADDYGWRDTGATGSEYYQTPNIDRIARGGINFTNGYAACQVSSPSRASIMTGLYPTRHGITNWIGERYGEAWRKAGRHSKLLPAQYEMNLSTEYTSLASALGEAGYVTFMAGKWHLGADTPPEAHGFDINKGGWESGGPKGGYFAPYINPALESGPDGENLSERLGCETAAFIEEVSKKKKREPFFAYLSFYAVHGPIQTTKERWEKYRDEAERLGIAENGFVVDRTLPVRQHQDNPVYAGLIEQMDNGVGIVLDKLYELGLDRNTIIIFTSDNGGVSSGDNYSTSNLPFRGGKGRQWEGGLRVPLFVQVPGMADRGSESAVPVSGIDFFPTALDYAGVDPAKYEVDGVSIRPLLEQRAISARSLFWHYPHYGNQGGEPSSVIRKGDWKLIYYHEDSRCELYNLAVDPGECETLNAQYPEKVGELKAELDGWLAATGARFPSADPSYDPVREHEYKTKAAKKQLAEQEQLRRDMLTPGWEPDPTWWGSMAAND